jgi:hypothetical protein
MKHATHDCPVPFCRETRTRWQAVCPSCWKRLPADLRSRITESKEKRARHLEARAAIEATRWLTENPQGQATARVTGDGSIAPP